MKNSLPFLILLTLFIFHSFNHQTEAAPTAPFVKHLSSILKWTRSSPKQSQTDGNVIQFESGYLVETVVEGNALGVLPYSIRVSQEGELFAVDAVNSNIVRITPPLSQYSRARFVAGSQGYTGHVDGKPTDARFNHPKGVTMDDKGNVYVADTSNMAIRKIGEAGVTTIAGGKSNIAGYRDGPSEDAKFSNDFDVVYVGRTCSLLVVDRGNAALRQISLNQEDCDNHHSSVTSTDVIMVIGAVLIGYMSCIIQQGVGLSIFTKTFNLHGRTTTTTTTTTTGSVPVTTKLKPTLIAENKEDQDAGWLSVGRLIMDFAKIGLESLASVFLYYIPVNLRPGKKGLTPIKDSLIVPEDAKPKPETPLVQKQRTPAPISDTRRAPKPTPLKETSAASKHRSSKRQEFTGFYNTGTSETPPPYTQHGSKSQKERTRHRHRDRSGEVRDAASGTEQKSSGEVKPVDYSDSKFDHYNIRNKYGSDDLFNF